MNIARFLLFVLLLCLTPCAAFAESQIEVHSLTQYWWAWLCVGLFFLSYLPVLFEEKTHLRKSKPVMLGAGLIWVVIALMAPQHIGDEDIIHDAALHGLTEYAGLLLFLLAAMTYISALEERSVFEVVRVRLTGMGLTLRQMFWVTGIIAFFMSGIADNLTTALVLGAVVISIGRDDKKFISIGCVNIVSAANAGGAFSPFGDITTLMAWQAGKAEFFEFFSLFLPSVVCFLVPAAIMSLFVSREKPATVEEDHRMKPAARGMIFLGLLTIVLAVSFEQILHLPAFLGMMTGLSLLMIYSWYVQRWRDADYDIFQRISAAEWDTLLFFFGVIFSVGGLSFLGFLALASTGLYQGLGPDVTNIALGVVSAIIDNIPVMFAVLSMDPPMDHFQWLLVTFTTGTGGSLLSVGSAAGVALMGAARGQYSFSSHLRWTPVICLGYVAGIATHYLVNG